MSIMDMFRGARQQEPAPQPAPTAQGQQQQAADPKLSQQPAPIQPEGGAGPSAEEDPMDAFKDIFSAPKEGEEVEQDFNPADMFQLDPQKIQQAVSQMNFTSAVSQDQLAKISAGGEEAVAALGQVMNTVAQTAFQQSMMGSAKLVEGALTKANQHLGAKMQKEIKRSSVSSSLREKHAILNHPATAPMIAALEQQFITKYPTSSAEQITKMAEDYLVNFSQGFAKSSSPAPAPDPKTSQEPDWNEFFNINN